MVRKPPRRQEFLPLSRTVETEITDERERERTEEGERKKS